MYKKREVSHFDIKSEFDKDSIIYTTASDRGIGKTAFIAKYAKENDLILLVRNKALEKMLKSSEEFEDVSIHSVAEVVRGLRSNNPERRQTLLVDDITEEQYNQLAEGLGMKLVGFVSVES